MPHFTWGESVRIKAGAPAAMRPGEAASVCAITEIGDETQASEYGVPVGGRAYWVEFGDGEAIEISDAWIEAIHS